MGSNVHHSHVLEIIFSIDDSASTVDLEDEEEWLLRASISFPGYFGQDTTASSLLLLLV